jgi:hypothetical protein
MRSLNIRDVEASPRDVKLFFILFCMFLVDLEQNGDKQDKRKRVGCLDEMVTTLSHMGLIPKSSDLWKKNRRCKKEGAKERRKGVV